MEKMVYKQNYKKSNMLKKEKSRGKMIRFAKELQKKKSTTDLEECCMRGKTLHSSAKENKQDTSHKQAI